MLNSTVEIAEYDEIASRHGADRERTPKLVGQTEPVYDGGSEHELLIGQFSHLFLHGLAVVDWVISDGH